LSGFFSAFLSIFQSSGWGCNAASREKSGGISHAAGWAGCFLVFTALRSLWGFLWLSSFGRLGSFASFTML